MIEYFDLIALAPLIFAVPMLPYARKVFRSVLPQKMAYGAATSGILLTFYGIWVGLTGFDVTDIEGSIPLLLEGLKTSFGSSIVGLAVSMLINILFVKQQPSETDSIIDSLSSLESSLNEFAKTYSDQQTAALTTAVRDLLRELEMGINTETKQTMTKFRESVEFLRSWQEKYVDEIKSVTDAMDKNAIVTSATSEQLDRTNDVLEKLGPVTEKIAASIGWVQKALPSNRPKGVHHTDEK